MSDCKMPAEVFTVRRIYGNVHVQVEDSDCLWRGEAFFEDIFRLRGQFHQRLLAKDAERRIVSK